MIGYASRTGTRRNLDALRAAGWRLLVSARGVLRSEGCGYALDNGAWTAHQRGEAFDEDAFVEAVDRLGDAMSAALGLPIEAPLLTWDKPRIIAEARALGLSSADAWSCYGTGPTPCGVCASRVEASIAWSSPMETT